MTILYEASDELFIVGDESGKAMLVEGRKNNGGSSEMKVVKISLDQQILEIDDPDFFRSPTKLEDFQFMHKGLYISITAGYNSSSKTWIVKGEPIVQRLWSRG